MKVNYIVLKLAKLENTGIRGPTHDWKEVTRFQSEYSFHKEDTIKIENLIVIVKKVEYHSDHWIELFIEELR